jgi:ubiquinone/menaquinone biosynthesis C-methylase UbiE
MAEPNYSMWSERALADVYLEGVRGAIPLANEQIEVMLRLIAANGRPIGRLLDLGCGDGILASAILDRHAGAEAVLVDFNSAMLDAAKMRLRDRSPAARFINFDYGDPAWVSHVRNTAPFDAIVSGFSIHHQPDGRKREIYREIFDLLSPGGIFVNVEHVASPTEWVRGVNDELFVDSLHRHHSDQSREQVASTYYHRPDKAANILAPVEDQCGWLRQIGFADVDCYFKIFELSVFGGRRR